MNFKNALQLVLKHEGGWVNHPSDPGGETNYGITKKVALSHGYDGDMRSIPMSTVQYIYQKDYWDKIRADLLPESIRFHVFDAAVNSGVKRAVEWLQEAAGASVDGIMGPKTIAAAQNVSPEKYSGIRLKFLTGLPHWDKFGRGWTRRIAENLINAY